MSKTKSGKKHEHAVLYNILKRGGEWDTELDALLTKNQKKFRSEFMIDIKRVNLPDDLIRYLSSLTRLEKFFLGVKKV